MTHLWLRSETRPNERRTALMPDGARALIADGVRLTVEESPHRCVPTTAYAEAGAQIAAEGSWPGAPGDALILGLKELPDDGTPLRHRHIMFGHAFKGQPDGRRLLARVRAGGGVLLDLEYLTDADGRRLAAVGYWAGFTGAAVALMALAAQARGETCPPVDVFPSAAAMTDAVARALAGHVPSALVIGALGRTGRGASALCESVGVAPTRWDMAETAHGGPFPEVLAHEVFLNCILAQPGAPVFVPADAGERARALRVIGDIACDPTSDFSPVKVYDRPTDWAAPVIRVHDDPPLDVMAIDNLPSLLPAEASEDFAAQLLPVLRQLDAPAPTPWTRAEALFRQHVAEADDG